MVDVNEHSPIWPSPVVIIKDKMPYTGSIPVLTTKNKYKKSCLVLVKGLSLGINNKNNKL